jgi:hypothetical protein
MQNASRQSAEMVTIHRSRNRVGSIERLAPDALEGMYVAGLMTLHRTLASMMQRLPVALINYYAESYFDQGNALAKLGKLSAAVATYHFRRRKSRSGMRPSSVSRLLRGR